MKKILALILCICMIFSVAALTSCDVLQSVSEISELVVEFDTDRAVLANFHDAASIALQNEVGADESEYLISAFDTSFLMLNDIINFEMLMFATAKALENESIKSFVQENFIEGYTIEISDLDNTYFLVSEDKSVVFKLYREKFEIYTNYFIEGYYNDERVIFSELIKTYNEEKMDLQMEAQIYYDGLESDQEGANSYTWQMNYMISLFGDDDDETMEMRYSFINNPENAPDSIFNGSYFDEENQNEYTGDSIMNFTFSTKVQNLQGVAHPKTETSEDEEEKSLTEMLLTEQMTFDIEEFDANVDFEYISTLGETAHLVVKDGKVSFWLAGQEESFYETDFDFLGKIPVFNLEY